MEKNRDLSQLKLEELRTLAKEYKIKNVAKYRKGELVEILINHEKQLPKPKTEKNEASAKVNEASVKVNETGTEVSERKSLESSSSTPLVKEVQVEPLKESKEVKEVKEEKPEVISKPMVEKRSNQTPERMHTRPAPALSSRNSDERVKYSNEYDVKGVLEIQDMNNFGFLRGENYLTSPEDVYVSPVQIRRFDLRTGDQVIGYAKYPKEGDKFAGLTYIEKINGENPGRSIGRPNFERLTPIYPTERINLEVVSENDLSTRIINLMAPIGKGQRGLIVAPPKAGKTTVLKKLAQNIRKNDANIKIIVLLIDERPEEVTDMQRSIHGEVIFSTFDEEPDHHTKVSKMVLERAKRMVEQKQDVVILMDSITRLARAYNLTVNPSGRTLSGGLDPAALIMPKKFFGAARNLEEGGSLTILATALVETGSRMDDMIFEEFKGTGNMEIHLDRRLQERRIFPAIDIYKSGTRKEQALLSKEEYEVSLNIRRQMNNFSSADRVTEDLLKLMNETKSNEEFVLRMGKLQNPSK